MIILQGCMWAASESNLAATTIREMWVRVIEQDDIKIDIYSSIFSHEDLLIIYVFYFTNFTRKKEKSENEIWRSYNTSSQAAQWQKIILQPIPTVQYAHRLQPKL
jgi:hypothetical protein